MKDEPKWLLEDMVMLDSRELQESNRRYDLLLFEQDLANCRRWREMKCNKMLKTIDNMMQAELHRRMTKQHS